MGLTHLGLSTIFIDSIRVVGRCASLDILASTPSKPRVAVVGAGSFGRNHVRIIHQSEHAELAGVLDTKRERAAEAAAAQNCPVLESLEELAAQADAAVVATPTQTTVRPPVDGAGCRCPDRKTHFQHSE